MVYPGAHDLIGQLGFGYLGLGNSWVLQLMMITIEVHSILPAKYGAYSRCQLSWNDLISEEDPSYRSNRGSKAILAYYILCNPRK